MKYIFLLNKNIKLFFIETNTEMNSGMLDRQSENWFREKQIIFKKMMFQGPKRYIAQMSEYTCSMETVQQNRVVLHFFLVNSTL